MSTITGTVTNSVTLGSGGYYSPLTIASGANVTDAGSGAALLGPSHATVVDYGKVSAGHAIVHYGFTTAIAAGVGIALDAGGYVRLGTTGLVSAYKTGIEIGGASGIVEDAGSGLLVLEKGYSIIGGIVGSGGGTNTLELSGGLGNRSRLTARQRERPSRRRP